MVAAGIPIAVLTAYQAAMGVLRVTIIPVHMAQGVGTAAT